MRLPRWPVLVLLLLALVAAASSWRQVNTNPWDNILLSAFARLQSGSLESDSIVIAIDDASLQQLGPWPWPRAIHGNIINALSGAQTIVYDVAFIGQRESASDAVLSTAVKQHGNVLLPLLAERNIDTLALETLLPYAPLPRYAQLGHIESPLSNGLLDTVYLKAGNANAQFPYLALAALAVSHDNLPHLKGLRGRRSGSERTGLWVRDFANVFIPLLAAPSASYSAADVLAGNVSTDVFRGKTVFVGAMSADIATPVPVRGLTTPLYDVQIQLTTYESLKQNKQLVRSNNHWALAHALVCLFLAFIPVFYRDLRLNLLCAVVALTWLFFVPGLVAYFWHTWVLQGPGLLACVLALIGIGLDRWLRWQRHIDLVQKHKTDDVLPQVMDAFAIAPLQGWFAVGLIQVDFFQRYVSDQGESAGFAALAKIRRIVEERLGKRLMSSVVYSDFSLGLCMHALSREDFEQSFTALATLVEQAAIVNEASTVAPVLTISAGAASADLSLLDQPELLLGNAEVALKQAIAQSRNQAIVFK